MKRNLNVYYFRVELEMSGEPSPDQLKAITAAFNLPEGRKYSPVLQSGGNVSIHGQRVYRNGVVLGTFSYIQLEDIPPKQNKVTNEVHAIDLEEDEGLGYYTPFLFDPSSHIFVYVSNRNGVNLSAIRKFIGNNFDIPKFMFSPVIEPAAIQQFLNTPNYKTVKFKVAKVENQAVLLPDRDMSIEEIIDAARKFEPGQLNYELRASRKGQLSTGPVRQLVQSLFRYKGDEVKQLIVDGYDDENIHRHFDFVTERLKDCITVERFRMGRFSLEDVYSQLEDKFLRHSQELRKQYGIK